MTEAMRIAAVVPAFNEAHGIADVVTGALAFSRWQSQREKSRAGDSGA